MYSHLSVVLTYLLLYQARRVNGPVYVRQGYRFSLSFNDFSGPTVLVFFISLFDLSFNDIYIHL